MISHIQKLPPKKQILFYSCLVALFWAFGFFVIIQPYSRNIVKLKQKAEDLRHEFIWMQNAQAQIDQLRHQYPAATKSTIEHFLKDFDFEKNVETIKSPSPNQVVLLFSSVLYTDLILFTEKLHEHGIILSAFTAKKLTQPGTVQAQMTFEASS